jgi:tRNA(Ile)-lysidine synthetase-like protein
LRGADSDLDEALVKSFSTANGIPFQRNSVEPTFFEGKSIQVEARNLRYQWFQDLAKSLNIHAIATAHHADDQIETVFLQMLRGTGISGYRGILPKQNLLIRPLLQVPKSELEDFAISSGISWREDVSNQKTDYKRNKIRLELLPLLDQISPGFRSVIGRNAEKARLHEMASMNQYLELKKQRCDPSPELQVTLNRRIDVLSDKVEVYERYAEAEKLLRIRAVDAFRKYEEKKFGKLNEIDSLRTT